MGARYYIARRAVPCRAVQCEGDAAVLCGRRLPYQYVGAVLTKAKPSIGHIDDVLYVAHVPELTWTSNWL